MLLARCVKKNIEGLKPTMRVRSITKKSNASLTGTGEVFKHCSSFAAPITQDEQLERRLFDRIKQQAKCLQDNIKAFFIPEMATSTDHDVCRENIELLSNSSSGSLARVESLNIRTVRDAGDPAGIHTVATNVVLAAFLGYRDHGPG